MLPLGTTSFTPKQPAVHRDSVQPGRATQSPKRIRNLALRPGPIGGVPGAVQPDEVRRDHSTVPEDDEGVTGRSQPIVWWRVYPVRIQRRPRPRTRLPGRSSAGGKPAERLSTGTCGLPLGQRASAARAVRGRWPGGILLICVAASNSAAGRLTALYIASAERGHSGLAGRIESCCWAPPKPMLSTQALGNSDHD